MAVRTIDGSDADWKSRLTNGRAVPRTVVMPVTVPDGWRVRLSQKSMFDARMRVGLEARSPDVAVSV